MLLILLNYLKLPDMETYCDIVEPKRDCLKKRQQTILITI